MKQMLDGKSEAEFKSNKIQILAELTKLRQLCCDPALLFEDYKGESAKVQMCMDLIGNAVHGGHKVHHLSLPQLPLYHHRHGSALTLQNPDHC